MKNKLAGLVLVIAAAASMATSEPGQPGMMRSFEVEALRLDDAEESAELRVHVRVPQHDLKQEDFTSAGMIFEARLDPMSAGPAIVKVVGYGGEVESGKFARVDPKGPLMNNVGSPYSLACAEGVCSFDAVVRLERSFPGTVLVGGTVKVQINWSADVPEEAVTPLTNELEISVER